MEAGMRSGARVARLLAIAAPAAGVMFASAPAAASPCTQLIGLHRANTTITAAQDIVTGSFVTPTTPPATLTGLPKFCRVAGYTTPTSDSHIGFEVWIPESGWNQKYMQIGCGGFCGEISFSSMVNPLAKGYAVAATDDGHQDPNGVDASWAVGHPEKIVDFGYRSLKETTDVAKDVIAAYKLGGPRRSYFAGCSDGGREALMEAQRYPLDFDGIIAGSPANNWTHLLTSAVWSWNAVAATAAGDLSQSDLNTVSGAVLNACVGKDGGLSTDGFLTNPLVCRFHPQSLSLSADKIEAVKKIFSGPPGIFPGYKVGADTFNLPQNGPLWLTDNGNPADGLAGLFGANFFGDIVYPNSGWTRTEYGYDKLAHDADVKFASILNSTDANLRPFTSHGGKLIQYVGWSDSAISPINDIDYRRALIENMGEERVSDFYRLFMVPGMSHCGGGPGPNAFGALGLNGPNPADPSDDVIAALDQWVENHRAPETIVATKYVNDNPALGVAFQRPLCNFPRSARYKSGVKTSASSFVCARPDDDDHDVSWAR